MKLITCLPIIEHMNSNTRMIRMKIFNTILHNSYELIEFRLPSKHDIHEPFTIIDYNNFMEIRKIYGED